MKTAMDGAAIPDSKLARAITEFIRDNETELLFNHSSRVYHFGALAGVHRGLKFDRELRTSEFRVSRRRFNFRREKRAGPRGSRPTSPAPDNCFAVSESKFSSPPFI